jgi:hypothetical protein
MPGSRGEGFDVRNLAKDLKAHQAIVSMHSHAVNRARAVRAAGLAQYEPLSSRGGEAWAQSWEASDSMSSPAHAGDPVITAVAITGGRWLLDSRFRGNDMGVPKQPHNAFLGLLLRDKEFAQRRAGLVRAFLLQVVA